MDSQQIAVDAVLLTERPRSDNAFIQRLYLAGVREAADVQGLQPRAGS
jgi:hypothetical protein